MKGPIKTVLIFASVVLCWVIAAPAFAWFLIVEEPLKKADVLYVLSGSAVYQERTKQAAMIFEEGGIGKIVLSDDGAEAGWSNTEERNPRFVDLEMQSLINHGVAREDIVILDSTVAGTIDEAKAVLAGAKKNNWTSVLLVTSGYHSRRALNTFRSVFDNSGIDVGIESVAPGERTPSIYTWWLSPRGWGFVGGEYLKTVYYWLFY